MYHPRLAAARCGDLGKNCLHSTDGTAEGRERSAEKRFHVDWVLNLEQHGQAFSLHLDWYCVLSLARVYILEQFVSCLNILAHVLCPQLMSWGPPQRRDEGDHFRQLKVVSAGMSSDDLWIFFKQGLVA